MTPPPPPPGYFSLPVPLPFTRAMYVYVRARVISGGAKPGEVAIEICDNTGHPVTETQIVVPVNSIVPAHHLKAAKR